MVLRQMESTGKDGEDAGFASLEETSNGPVAAGNQGGRLTERARSTGTALDRPAACQRKFAIGGQGGRHHAERKLQERGDMSFAKAESFQTRDARNMTISLTPFRTIRPLTPNLPLTHPDRTLSLRGERLRVRGVSAFSFLTVEAGLPSRGKEPARMNRGEDQGFESSSPSLSPPHQSQGSHIFQQALPVRSPSGGAIRSASTG